MRMGYKALILCTALGVLGAVFMLYTRSEFLLMLANQVWTCF